VDGLTRMKRGHRGATKDYSDIFLVAILIGIVVIVLSLMMAIAHSTSQYPERSGAVIRSVDQQDVFRDRSQLKSGSAALPN
jgi:hypothetical protein